MASTYSKNARSKSASVETLNTQITDEDMRDWSKAAAKVKATEIEVVPKGWYTQLELCELLAKSPSQVYRLVRTLQAAGKLETRKFVVQRVTRSYTAVHYKLLK